MDYSKLLLDEVKQLETRAIDKIEKLDTNQREHADRILQLEQRGTARSDEIVTTRSSDFSGKILKSIRENSELIGKAQNVRLEVKAAGDALTTGMARTIQSGGVGIPGGAAIGIHNGLSSRVIGAVSAVEYSRYLANEGAAAKQSAEGAAKAAVRPTFSLIVETAATIAGYTKISKQALNDSNELAMAIDVTLRRSIATALDTYLTGGTWGGAAGLLAHATAYTSAVYTGLADAVSEGVATMQTAGFNPDVVAISPDDWLGIVVAKASGSGEYLSGAYLQALPESLRGLRRVLSPTVTAGKAMLLDSSQVELLIVEDMAIEIGTDADDFTKNIRTVLAEMRVIPTFRAVGAARLITPKP